MSDQGEEADADEGFQRFDCIAADEAALSLATDVARQAVERGECIVLPTDTVYGIGADAFNPTAVQRLLDAKNRGRDMPPPVLIAEANLIRVLATDVPEEVRGRAVVCERLDMFPVECVARGYLTGSGLLDYRRTGEVCGLPLPGGLVDGSRLPEPMALERVAYRLNAFGFPLWTFAALVAGPIWAEYAWGSYWNWDPKEVWAFITWVCYAAYLHARATAGWKGKAAAWLALIGFASLLFNFVGINFFFGGGSMHSYA